jgi:phage terminase large subunit
MPGDVVIRFPAREYQRGLIEYFRKGGKHASAVWHRKAGKDRTAVFVESELAFKRVGLYWHALPKYEDARKVIWDAITPEGERLIDVSFPDAICRKKNAHEMKIELLNGSIWQPIGADNFNSLVGASPVHVTYSEFALMHPKARQFIRPALAANNGSELSITTPRGYNHAYDLHEYAKSRKDWYASLLTVDDTGVLSKDVLDEERATMPDELFRQEYYCDFSAANIGAILGRYLEAADKEGRITDDLPEPGVVDISSDIGFHDTATWWFWDVRPDGFALTDYDEDSGLDASEWIPRLQEKGYKIRKIWLPHDAKIKTFQTRHSALEQFLDAFGAERVEIVPQSKVQDRINAARVVMPRCRFHRTRCKPGLNGLRNWSFEYNDNTKTYSRSPKHDWASHPGDGYSYGAQVMQERAIARPKRSGIEARAQAAGKKLTFNDVVRMHEQRTGSRAGRI